MSSNTCKQKGLLRRLSKNIVNMRRLFKSTERRGDDSYDSTKVTQQNHHERIDNKYHQGCPLLDLLLEPCMLDMVCDYLDVWSISRLEECCHLLRGLVVENKLYRRRVKKIVCLRTPGDWIQEDWEDEGDSLEHNSRYYKSKLFGYQYR